MKKITLFCLLLLLTFIPTLVGQSNNDALKPSFVTLLNHSVPVQNKTSAMITGCNTATNGLFPSTTFTPNCGGNTETISNIAWAGQYSNVNVIANRQYRFLSSVISDYITITNSTGTITYASGTQPVVWDSGSTTGIIRYYLHSNANCGNEQVNRTRYVRCLDASNCVPPSNLAVSNVTSNSCKMTWTASSPVPSSNYDIYIVTTNIAPDANSIPTVFSTTNLSTSIALNVAAGTTYYYWIRSNCGATIGTWISGGSFTTPPALICNGAINGLYPDATFTPACTGLTEQIVTDAYAGEYCNLNALTNKQYTFRSSIATDFITITNATGTAVLASGLTPLSWLSGTTSGVVRYHLHSNSNCGAQSTNRIRSLQCTNAISCGVPSGLSVSNITSNSCQISYVAPTPAPSSFEFYISTISTTPISTTSPTFIGSTFPAIAYNLTSSTTYYYWIRSNCNGTTSAWVSGGNFTTIASLICNGATYGIFPATTFTPTCTGNAEQITSTAWAGTYSNVNVLSNKQYTFTSSVATDFMTITNATGTTVLASGVTPLVWNSNTASGVIRYHLNSNANCGTQDANRIKSIKCVSSSCNPPSQLFSDGVTSTSVNIGWLAPTPAPSNGYVYCYSTVNDPFSSAAVTGNYTDTLVTLSNLLPNTTYYFWVKSNCGTTQTNWISGGSFTTLSAVTSCWQTINAGYSHSLAIKTDGTLWAWGDNALGALGDGTNTNRNIPTQIGTGNNWLKVAGGAQYSVGIKTNGTLWAWGSNLTGQLGDGTTINKNTPIQIGSATDWIKIAVGNGHTLAIKANGTLWAWGDNSIGQLGDGTTVNKNVPTPISTEPNWQSVAVGAGFSLATFGNGQLFAWGNNSDGQLGDGTTTNRLIPTPIGNAFDWANVAAGYSHSVGRKSNGLLYTWGNNTFGQLGDGTNLNRLTPTSVNDQVASIDAGWYYTVGTSTLGNMLICGQNNFGQLGDGTNSNRNSSTWSNSTNHQMVSAGAYHTFTIYTDGSLGACGINEHGRLGDGTIINKNTLTPIACPTSLDVEDFTNASNDVKAYPNPIKDVLNISFDKEITSVSVYNLLGQEVLTKFINANEGSLDTSNLASGTYFVKVIADSEVKTLKVIKK
jgi:alpha-tubulin suppressor-like RCC1 family protein